MLHFTGAKPSSYVQPGRLIKSATGRLLREVGNKRPAFERIGTSIPRTETVRDTHIDITMLTIRNSRIGPNAVEVLSESVLMTVPIGCFLILLRLQPHTGRKGVLRKQFTRVRTSRPLKKSADWTALITRAQR